MKRIQKKTTNKTNNEGPSPLSFQLNQFGVMMSSLVKRDDIII